MANRMTRPVQLGFMSPARANQLLLQGFPQPAATVRRTDQYYAPGGVVPPMSLSPAQQSAARAQANAALRPIMPLEASAMRRDELRTPPGPMQRIGQAFRQPLTSPTGQGLAAAALTGLEYGGPSMTPTSLGQGLARMGAAGLQAFTKAEQARVTREAATAEAERQRRMDEALAQYRRDQLDLRRREIGASERAATIAAETKAAEALLPDVKGESTLRKEYDGESDKFVTAKLGFEKLQESSLGEPSAAKDLALIFGYMKVLDPTSVVRESEQASASNAAGVPERIRNTWNRILTGERLTPAQRLDFISSGRKLFLPALAAQEERENFYRGLSEAYEFDADRVVPTKLPKKGSRTNPYIYNNEAEAEAAGLTGFAYIGGQFAEIEE